MLPYDVTFVLPRDVPQIEASTPDELTRLIDGRMIWTSLTYSRLKQSGYNVSAAHRLDPGGICVLHADMWRPRHLSARCFLVVCRSDRGRQPIADMRIVQNEANVESPSDILIPHWPHPGLIPRASDRGDRIETLAYKGRLGNLYEPFRAPEFHAAMDRLGVRVVLDVEEGARAEAWRDYSDVDLAYGVRDLTKQDSLVKPATKLVNAWLAGVPAILGPEPAFHDLRRSDLDYFEVRSPEDVIEAVRRLKDNPGLYRAMIANGLRRAEEFTNERVVEHWVGALSGPIAEGYRRWLASSRLGRLARFPGRVIRQKLANREAAHHRRHGLRIVSGVTT